MVTLLAGLLTAAYSWAGIIDMSPPQDIIGNWKFDLYDSTNQQRGTLSNPFFVTSQTPADVPSNGGSITTRDVGTASATQFSGQISVSGTPTPSSSVTFPLAGAQTAMIMITGNWTGTLQVEVSSDGGSTYQPRAIHVLGSATFASQITGNVVGSFNATAKTSVRVRAVSAMTGFANVQYLRSNNLSNIYVANPVKITDSTATVNPPGLTVKASGSYATTADTAAVVEHRPYLSRVLSGNATTTIKTGPGVLRAIVVGAPTGGTIVAYDSTSGSGAAITALTAGTPSGGLLTSSGFPSPDSVMLDVGFTNGLTIVTAGSGNNSFTVIYR